MTLRSAVPALPVRDVVAAVRHYEEGLGFSCVHRSDDFAVLVRDDVRLHIWQTNDSGWAERPSDDLRASPVCSGGETFLAGTASCRVALDTVAAVHELHRELAAADVLHPSEHGTPHATDFGTTEFAALDADGNLIEFLA